MPFVTLNLGLELTIPTNGTVNWGTTVFNTTWTKISQHDHTGSGNGSLITAAALAAGAVGSAALANNFGVTQAATLTPAGLTQTINFNNGMVQTVDLGAAAGNVTLTLSNPVQGAYYLVYVIQAASPLDLVFPASVKWPQNQQIILSQTNDAVDYFYMYYDGTDFRVLLWDLDIS